ncbi:MAG: hypothetical protein NTX73_13590, partial [Rhodobacterales bacterium]|nr:hypothetical protein [Rhodobacterales bacterium]
KPAAPPQKWLQNREIGYLSPKEATPQRSGGNLGEAEALNQTFLLLVYNTSRFASTPPQRLTSPPEKRGPFALCTHE